MIYLFQLLKLFPLLVIGIVFWTVFYKSYKELRFRMQIYAYLIFQLCTYLMMAAYVLLSPLNILSFYPLFQFVFVIAGGIHVYLVFVRWRMLEEQRKTIISFTTLVLVIGMIVLMLINIFKEADTYISAFILSGSLTYFIPIALYRMSSQMMRIPDRNYRWWQYPYNKELREMSESELRDPILIGFWIQKEMDSYYTFFRAKAPIKMDLGELFYRFVLDYNERHPDTPITFSAENPASFCWGFYRKRWWSTMRLLDPDRAVFMNRLKEDDIIICRRMNY